MEADDLRAARRDQQSRIDAERPFLLFDQAFAEHEQHDCDHADGKHQQVRLAELPGASVYVIDVGVERPHNFALGSLRLSGEEVTPGSLLQLDTELSAVGNNLNQLTRLANTARAVPHIDELRRATEGPVFFVGDSAGHCLPLTAEGIRTAFYFGLQALASANGMVDGYPPPLYFMFGSVAMLSTLGDVRMMTARGIAGARRIARRGAAAGPRVETVRY